MIKTDKCIIGVCKCGSIIVASMIIGGLEIDSDTTETLAEVSNGGGEIKIVDTNDIMVQMNRCKCEI